MKSNHTVPLSSRLGGTALILGSLLFAAYCSLSILFLPLQQASTDLTALVRSPAWCPILVIALLGILLLIGGFSAVHAITGPSTGIMGALGFGCLALALILQACSVTWELFLYPILAAHPESAFLLKDSLIDKNPRVAVFIILATLTLFLGFLLYSLALYRSRSFPRSAPILIAVGAILYAVTSPFHVYLPIICILIFSAGCSILGACLMKAKPRKPLRARDKIN